ALVMRIRRRWVMPNYAMPAPRAIRLPRDSTGFAVLLELRFVDGLLEGLFARDLLGVQQLLDGGVHQAHARGGAALHGVLQLIHLALADEVGDRGCVDQDFQRSDAP